MKRGRVRGTVLALLAAGGIAARGDIRGSKHDLSGYGWGTDEVCVFCHTPHNAKTPQLAPLWNHLSTTATYTLYTSPTLKGTPQQPRDGSKICLSCHDGTVAIDSYGTRTGSHMMTGPANVGTDLSDDHPVSILWDHRVSGNLVSCFNCHFIHVPGTRVIPFYNRYVECASCHEPHNKYPANGKLLRKTLSQSQLCRHCHGK